MVGDENHSISNSIVYSLLRGTINTTTLNIRMEDKNGVLEQ